MMIKIKMKGKFKFKDGVIQSLHFSKKNLKKMKLKHPDLEVYDEI